MPLKSLSNLAEPTVWFPSAPVGTLQGADSESSGNSGSHNNYSGTLSVTGFTSVKSQDTQTDAVLTSQSSAGGRRRENGEQSRRGGFLKNEERGHLLEGMAHT